MAIGLSRLFNVDLPLNFDSPYKAAQHHRVLAALAHDAVALPARLPLYPARRQPQGRRRRYVNLMVTMLLGGLWHGAGWTFVIWGALHGVYLVVNHALAGCCRSASRCRFKHVSQISGRPWTHLCDSLDVSQRGRGLGILSGNQPAVRGSRAGRHVALQRRHVAARTSGVLAFVVAVTRLRRPIRCARRIRRPAPMGLDRRAAGSRAGSFPTRRNHGPMEVTPTGDAERLLLAWTCTRFSSCSLCARSDQRLARRSEFIYFNF